MFVGYYGEPVAVQVQSPEAVEVRKGVRHNLAYGVAGQSQVQEACHVGEVPSPHRRDEVLCQPQLHGSAVDDRGHKEQPCLGTEDGEGR